MIHGIKNLYSEQSKNLLDMIDNNKYDLPKENVMPTSAH